MAGPDPGLVTLRGRQTVVRLRAALTGDRYGNDVRDWEAADELPIPGCSLQPLETGTVSLAVAEDLATGAVVTRWRLFAPQGTELLPSDRIRHPAMGGRIYDIQGDVQEWDGTARHGYVTCLLERSGAPGEE